MPGEEDLRRNRSDDLCSMRVLILGDIGNIVRGATVECAFPKGAQWMQR